MHSGAKARKKAMPMKKSVEGERRWCRAQQMKRSRRHEATWEKHRNIGFMYKHRPCLASSLEKLHVTKRNKYGEIVACCYAMLCYEMIQEESDLGVSTFKLHISLATDICLQPEADYRMLITFRRNDLCTASVWSWWEELSPILCAFCHLSAPRCYSQNETKSLKMTHPHERWHTPPSVAAPGPTSHRLWASTASQGEVVSTLHQFSSPPTSLLQPLLLLFFPLSLYTQTPPSVNKNNINLVIHKQLLSLLSNNEDITTTIIII